MSACSAVFWSFLYKKQKREPEKQALFLLSQALFNERERSDTGNDEHRRLSGRPPRPDAEAPLCF